MPLSTSEDNAIKLGNVEISAVVKKHGVLILAAIAIIVIYFVTRKNPTT
ncbi:MAG TPA: hypothetical protein VF487_13160 [Chitinophagaceae bacterium]